MFSSTEHGKNQIIIKMVHQNGLSKAALMRSTIIVDKH